ncbi:MAG: hypothetical protein O2968_15825 [Acidobacteria bacterium]|nr:hypothetical protein [Acidobacteriota bacterium]
MIRARLCFLLIAMSATPLMAQDAPRPRSQAEATSINACVGAPDMETRLDMCQNFLNAHPKSDFREMAMWMGCTTTPQVPVGGLQYCEKLVVEFKNTEHKEGALYLTMLGYQQSNDFEGMLTYGELVLEENPEHWGALLALAYVFPLRTRDHDLDKEEKLSQAEGYAKRALDVVPRTPNPNPEAITDDEWLMQKKDLMAETHKALGAIAMKRKDWASAEGSYRQSLQMANEQTGELFYQVAKALKEQGKGDEALGMLDQSIARGGFKMPNGRDAASILKAEIVTANQPAATSAPAAAPAPAQP